MRVKLGPSKLWTGLVLHHKNIFVSHVISKLNETDRCFFAEVNRESRGVLAYAGVDVSELGWNVYECTSISTLEWAWNNMAWGYINNCLLYTSPSPRDATLSRMPSSA